MKYVLEPYVGALPIGFDLKIGEVESLIGPPGDSDRHEVFGKMETVEFRSGKGLPERIYYSKAGKVVEMGFGKDCELIYKKKNLIKEKDIFKLLAKEDHPKKFMSTVVFLKLGIAMNESHNKKSGDKSIVVFVKGRRDRFLDRMVNMKL